MPRGAGQRTRIIVTIIVSSVASMCEALGVGQQAFPLAVEESSAARPGCRAAAIPRPEAV